MFKGVFILKEINHWCAVCGKGYHSCDSCNDIKAFTPWRSLTDSIEHFKIFTTLRDFNNGLISKDDAKRLLANVDLSDKDSFKDGSKKVLAEIYKEDYVKIKSRKNKRVADLESVSKVETSLEEVSK